jgi:rhodanese-related sulfurtransferase
MALTKGYRALLEDAYAAIETISVADAIAALGGPDMVLVDVRDIRERQRDGYIPGSFHAPRGMLEFWIDPESPYYKDVFVPGKLFIFHCARDWRGALATKAVLDMGLREVRNLDGGLESWKAAGGAIELPE